MEKDEKTLEEKKKLINKQKGAAVVMIILIFTTGFYYCPINVKDVKTPAERLVFTIRCLFVSSFSIVFAIRSVALTRKNTNAIDPVNGGGESLVDVPNRILRNTVEQFFLHMIALLTLSSFLDEGSMKAIPMLTFIFIFGRTLFYLGYTYSPLYRALGFASTFLPTIATYAYCSFCIVKSLVT
ncbi:Hypothetical predicted protein [Mytilus galloprovincialis]|uniref:Uncharacterized protein n=1 Tax=Mytilus galloprovincialis TaxID=29158 RepID=A0A8B6GIJ6_MYTGA|nr:Hypothetical predicted protein [Mytilus galloprovincialis]